MKRIPVILFLLLLLLSCDDKNDAFNKKINYSKDSSFVIYKNTFNYEHKGELERVAYFENKYFCVINHSDKKLIILDEEGTYLNEVKVPKPIKRASYSYNIFIENDSLFLKKTKSDKENYVLVNNNTEFQYIEKRNFKIFEDKEYDIYSNCHNEIGGRIFFHNKETNKKYEAKSTCAIIVNKLNKEYYVTNYLAHFIGLANINKISDPTQLKNSKWDLDEIDVRLYSKGVENLLDTVPLYISTSFVVNDELMHIYSDKDSTFIAIIENGILKPIYTFDFQFQLLFNQQIGERRQLLTFKETKENKEGILLIDSNVFTFHYLR